MERLIERVTLANKALDRLAELAGKEAVSDVERDALIQRFEFSYELLWKCAKDYLRVNEGLDSASPRRVIRDCHVAGLLSDEETEMALRMAADRNLTVHTYDEDFAQKLSVRIADYAKLLRTWLDRMDR